MNRDCSHNDGLHATIKTVLVQPAKLEKLLKQACLSFSLSPRRILKRPAESADYRLTSKHLVQNSRPRHKGLAHS